MQILFLSILIALGFGVGATLFCLARCVFSWPLSPSDLPQMPGFAHLKHLANQDNDLPLRNYEI